MGFLRFRPGADGCGIGRVCSHWVGAPSPGGARSRMPVPQCEGALTRARRGRRWRFHGIPAVRLLIGNLERHRRQVAQGEAALLPLALASGRLQLYFGEGLQNQIVSGACLQLVAVSFQHEFETVV